MENEKVDEIVSSLIATVEKQTGRTVQRVWLGEDRPADDVLEALFLFTDGKRLDSRITVVTASKQIAFRIQGNYI